MINLPKRLQSIRWSLFKKAYTHYTAFHILIPLICVIHFENLYMTDIKELYPSLSTGKINIKSRVSMKKRSEGDSIGCKKL